MDTFMMLLRGLLLLGLFVAAVRLIQNSVLADPDEFVEPGKQWRRGLLTAGALFGAYVGIVLVLVLGLSFGGWLLVALAFGLSLAANTLIFKLIYNVSLFRAFRASGRASGIAALGDAFLRMAVGLVGAGFIANPLVMVTGLGGAALFFGLGLMMRNRQRARFEALAEEDDLAEGTA